MYCLIAAGLAISGFAQAPAALNGNYYSSCGTSYCRGVEVHCTPQAPVSTILNQPTGYGYSVTYNYGLEPEPGRSWSGSSSYNHGSYRIK